MLRRTRAATLALLVLAARGERIEAVYREGVELAFEESTTLSMEMDEAKLSINGVELPPGVLEESGIELPTLQQETELRMRDHVLAAEDGRPTRVRRTFERVHRKSVEGDEEKSETGPLEGRVLSLAEAEPGEVVAVLDDEGDEVESVYREGYRLTNNADRLLPDTEVAIGDRWPVEGEALRQFMSLGAGPTFFEKDAEEEGPFAKALDEASAATAEVELAAIEERDGLRCAVLAFTIELRADVDDPTAFGVDFEDAQDVVAALGLALDGHGRLWYALDEGRAVAMEQSFEGTMTCHLEMQSAQEGRELHMKADLACSIDGESSCRWVPAE